MATEARVKVLKQKRGVIKAQITNFQNFLNHYKLEDPNLVRLNVRLESFKNSCKNFDAIQDELEILDEENTDSLLIERFEIQNNYLDAITEAEQLITIITSPAQNVHTPANNLNSSSNANGFTSDSGNIETPTQSVRTRRVKLPETSLPSFSGEYEDWLSFKDEFISLIHQQDDLTNVQKLQYLKAAVKGEAAQKIKTMSITDENYQRAWDLLQNAYADERLIISTHLSLLLKLPVQVRETAHGLRKLADDTLQHVESLATLGINVTEEILVQNLELKLHKNTVDKWEESLKSGSFPKLDQMIAFLYSTSKRLSKREKDTPLNDTSSHIQKSKPSSQIFTKRYDKSHKGQTFLTSATNKCTVCSGKFHPLNKCKRFYSFDFEGRIQAARAASVCLICLRAHVGKDCKFKKCMVCEQPNHFSLHDHQSRVNTD